MKSIKVIIKIVCMLALPAAAIGIFVFQDRLKKEGEPPLVRLFLTFLCCMGLVALFGAFHALLPDLF